MNIGSNFQSSISPLTKNQVFSRAAKSMAPKYSTFDRSHRYLTAFDEGYCIPFFIDEVYPSDIEKCDARHLTRLATPVHPFMDALSLDCIYFFVPNRIIWNNWKAFLGERRRTDQPEVTYQVPTLNSGAEGVEVGSIFDYAGIPPKVPNLEFSALPFRAINLCYNEWLRDENLCDWLNVGGIDVSGEYDPDTEFGDSDQLSNYSLFKRAKIHDYFTSALPFQQKGEPEILSFGSEAPVVGNGMSLGLQGYEAPNTSGPFVGAGLNAYTSGATHLLTASVSNYGKPVGTIATGGDLNAAIGVTTDSTKSGLIADLTQVSGFSISDFRIKIQLQALKELDARFGTRYKEYVQGHFNTTISDATLDRPEYLGGYSVPFSVIPVASTSGTTDNPQGNLAAFAVTPTNTFRAFAKGFEEHGWIIGFCSVRSRQSYQQGLQRFWSRKNKYDFYDPMLDNISEQAIKMKEILAQDGTIMSSDGTTPVNEITFGYQEYAAELRYFPDMITGEMRSQSNLTLDVWHLAQEYAPSMLGSQNLGVPLNQDFIEENPPIERVVAVTEQKHFFGDNWFNVKSTRQISLYSVPSFLYGGRL